MGTALRLMLPCIWRMESHSWSPSQMSNSVGSIQITDTFFSARGRHRRDLCAGHHSFHYIRGGVDAAGQRQVRL